jgi:predicted RNA-binding Zn-ribbon protein involved in translation (DUF1610 family)
MNDPVADWLDEVRKRCDTNGNEDGKSLFGFIDRLLGQLVMDEKRRMAVAAVVAEQHDITWPCDSCGDRRPDAFISVAHRKVTGLAPRGSVVQINGRYCNDRPDCLRGIPAWLDEMTKPVLQQNGCYRPANMDKPPLRVHHIYLQTLEGMMVETESGYRALCPLCGGALLVYRNQQTAVLSRRDRCVRCGQMYIYLDEQINGEPLEPLEPHPSVSPQAAEPGVTPSRPSGNAG